MQLKEIIQKDPMSPLTNSCHVTSCKTIEQYHNQNTDIVVIHQHTHTHSNTSKIGSLSKVSVFQWLYQLSPLIYRFPFPALSLCLSVSLEFIWRNWVIYFIGFFKIWILLVISLWCFSHILWPFMLLGNW